MITRIENGVTVISTGDNGLVKNKNGYTGIHLNKRDGNYRVEINHKRKKYHLGFAATVEEAIPIRKEAELHVKHGDFIEWYNMRRKKRGKKN